MTLKEDIVELVDKTNEVEKSLAMEMLEFSKQQLEHLAKNYKTLYIVLIIVIILWFASMIGGYYYITHFGIVDNVETSQEIDEIDNIENSYIINGGDYSGENKTNPKEN